MQGSSSAGVLPSKEVKERRSKFERAHPDEAFLEEQHLKINAELASG